MRLSINQTAISTVLGSGLSVISILIYTTGQPATEAECVLKELACQSIPREFRQPDSNGCRVRATFVDEGDGFGKLKLSGRSDMFVHKSQIVLVKTLPPQPPSLPRILISGAVMLFALLLMIVPILSFRSRHGNADATQTVALRANHRLRHFTAFRDLDMDVTSMEFMMKQMVKAFGVGFIKGAKETPAGYFAPAIALWRWVASVVRGHE